MSKITIPQYKNPIFEMIGYEPKTTFWSDFSIADVFGVDSVKDTYNRAKGMERQYRVHDRVGTCSKS